MAGRNEFKPAPREVEVDLHVGEVGDLKEVDPIVEEL